MSQQQAVAGPRNGITAQKILDEINKRKLVPVTGSGKTYRGQKSVTIENFDFTVNTASGKQLNVTDCEEVIIQYCKFRDKTTLGQGCNITGAKTKRVIVRYCLLENFSFTEANGGEPMRLGNSQYSGCEFECIVEKCVFRNLKSDPETISIKSARNTVQDCFFLNNQSNVTVRHGGYATIQHNYFETSGGVRLHGYGNNVLNNCFANFGTGEKFAPIIIRYGNQEKDPNWTDQKTPSRQTGSSHAVYARTVNNRIEGNEFKNCKVTIITAEKGASLAPKDNTIANNKPVDKFGFETAGATTTTTTTTATAPTAEEPAITPIPVAPTTTESKADRYGINFLYKSAVPTDTSKGLMRYMNMDNPTADAFLNKEEKANMRKEADGSWSLDGKDTGKYQVRLGLWMKPPQVNIEATVYAQYMSAIEGLSAGSYAFQLYKGVGNHSSSNNGCTGFAYKARVRLDKSVVITKEVTHPNYAGNKGGLKKLTKDPRGNYIGTKLVVYNMAPIPGGRTPVKIEVWCDEQGMDKNGVFTASKQNWVKMAEFTDKGGWAAGSAESVGNCEPLEIGNNTGKRKPDEIYNQPVGTTDGNIVTYRTDGVRTKIKFFSVRAINTILETQPTAGTATAPTTAPTPQSAPTTTTAPTPTTIPPTNEVPATSTTQPSPPQEQLTNQTPEYELHKLVNEARKNAGVRELQYDDALAVIAEKHSVDMQIRNFFAHTNPSGNTAFDRAQNAGYAYRAYGENIAWFSTSNLSNMSNREIADKFFGQWWNSPGHKTNMLSSNFDRQGLGIHAYGNKIWATQNLASK